MEVMAGGNEEEEILLEEFVEGDKEDDKEG